MSHFAKVVDGKVIQVIVAEKEFFDTFVDSSPGEWIQTQFYCGNMARGNAGRDCCPGAAGLLWHQNRPYLHPHIIIRRY